MKCSRRKVSDQIANWLEQPVLGPHAHSKTLGNETCSDVLDLDALLYASGIPGPGRGDPFGPFWQNRQCAWNTFQGGLGPLTQLRCLRLLVTAATPWDNLYSQLCQATDQTPTRLRHVVPPHHKTKDNDEKDPPRGTTVTSWLLKALRTRTVLASHPGCNFPSWPPVKRRLNC